MIAATARRALLLVILAALAAFAFGLVTGEHPLRNAHAAPNYQTAPMRYAPRIEVYTEANVWTFNDLTKPEGYETLEQCKERLLEMRDFTQARLLPIIAKTEKIVRWRGVCVDVLEAMIGNQTSDA